VLCAAYRQILALQNRLGPINVGAEKVLRDMILDWTTRVGTDKSAPHFLHMDDKWMFTRDYFAQACSALGFSMPILMPQYEPDDPTAQFAGMTETILRLHSGLARSALPDWNWELLGELDRTFSPEMRRDLLLEGVVVLRVP
jgi:hypothetical protein